MAWVEKDHNDHPISTPLQRAGLSTTRPGCPERHPAWMDGWIAIFRVKHSFTFRRRFWVIRNNIQVSLHVCIYVLHPQDWNIGAQWGWSSALHSLWLESLWVQIVSSSLGVQESLAKQTQGLQIGQGFLEKIIFQGFLWFFITNCSFWTWKTLFSEFQPQALLS